ncbi:hypothetical protein ACFU53_22120 [Streptomyces sp. NPDC057474]|uniref:hypothetical protein n=1 Tax=Streptomyces sp. NPDC057474 TaxID=3346144 RepID=UPI00369F01BA
MSTGENDNGQLRLLPVRPRPRTGEGTDSYVRRLARANHLRPSYLRRYLVGFPDYGRGKRPPTGSQQSPDAAKTRWNGHCPIWCGRNAP